MTYLSSGNEAESAVRSLMALLAAVNDGFRFGGEAFYAFESWLELETVSGHLVCWLADINCTPAGWEIDRTVTRDGTSGGDEISPFPRVRSAAFAEFVDLLNEAIESFLDSARSYQFG